MAEKKTGKPEPKVQVPKGYITGTFLCGACKQPIAPPIPPTPHNIFIGVLTAHWRSHVLTCPGISRGEEAQKIVDATKPK